jgi:hypothetical protein
MITFSSSVVDDVQQIEDWTAADPYHQNQKDPFWWLTGNDCLIAGCVEDESGPVLYFRFDEDEGFARLHTQFAPEDQVSKKRVAVAIFEAIPVISLVLKSDGLEGIVYESTSPSLIQFMSGMGFKPRPGGKEVLDDYVLVFEEK